MWGRTNAISTSGGKKWATGTFVVSGSSKTISGLTFAPKYVFYYTQYLVGGVWTNQGIMINTQEMAFYSSGNMFSGYYVNALSQSSGNSVAYRQTNYLTADGFTCSPSDGGGTQTIKWFAFE